MITRFSPADLTADESRVASASPRQPRRVRAEIADRSAMLGFIYVSALGAALIVAMLGLLIR